MNCRQLVTLVILAATAVGQEPNGPTARLTINGFDHPPAGAGPLTANLLAGGAFLGEVSGAPGQPFLVAVGVVSTPGLVVPGLGIQDLAPSSLAILIDGFSPSGAFATTGTSGTWSAATTAPGPGGFGLQAIVGDPAAPLGLGLSAATDVAVSATSSVTATYPEGVLGDDVTVTYYHQALAFPFYGQVYDRTHIDTNGYASFGAPVPSDWIITQNRWDDGPPRVAPYWSDMHMSSTVASAFSVLSPGPASVVVTETDQGGGLVDLVIEWRFATEAQGPSVQWDYAVKLDSQGNVQMLFGYDLVGGWFPTTSFSLAFTGITPGGGLSTAPGVDVFSSTGVNALVAMPNDAIYEFFTSPPFPLADFLVPGQMGQSLTFTPIGSPLGVAYAMSQQ